MNQITPRHLFIAVAVLVLALAGHAYISTVAGTAKAEQVKADVTQQISTLRNDLAGELTKIKADRAQAKTPQQIVQRLPQYITLPKPIIVQGPQPVAVAGETHLPDAPTPQTAGANQGGLLIPAESVSSFWTHETQCQEDSLNLAECKKELPLLTQRAQAAETAMKGGSFWKRTKANAKWLVVGGLVGAGAVAVVRR